MTTIFTVKFREHLASEKISNLKGILEISGIGREEAAGQFVLEVTRKNRVSGMAIQLNNWAMCGWLTWTSDPKLEPYETV